MELFAHLLAQRDAIEASLDEPLTWHERENATGILGVASSRAGRPSQATPCSPPMRTSARAISPSWSISELAL